MPSRKIYVFVLSAALLVPVCFADTSTPTTAVAPAVKSSALKGQLKIGTGIENRNIVGESTVFSDSTEQLSAWSLIEGAQTPTEIKHVWLFEGKEVLTITLKVNSTHFRTYSRIQVMGRKGNWAVQVLDENGSLVTSEDFQVKAETPAVEAPAVPAAK